LSVESTQLHVSPKVPTAMEGHAGKLEGGPAFELEADGAAFADERDVIAVNPEFDHIFGGGGDEDGDLGAGLEEFAVLPGDDAEDFAVDGGHDALGVLAGEANFDLGGFGAGFGDAPICARHGRQASSMRRTASASVRRSSLSRDRFSLLAALSEAVARSTSATFWV
jgi:hypothetical protein